MITDLADQLIKPEYTFTQVLQPHGWIVVISFLVTAAITPLVRGLAMRFRIVDKPDSFLKPHGRPVAYLGGVAIYIGWLAGMAVLLGDPEGFRWTLGLILAGGIAMLTGLADDIVDLKPVLKLGGQMAAAVVLLAFGIGQNIADLVLSPLNLALSETLIFVLSVPMSLFLVVAASNAANLLDGMDGLCSGVTGIISLCFLVLSAHLAMYAHSPDHDQVRIVAALAMFGAVCGFLPYNSNPARIFMGDAGSLLLGFYAAAMMLMFGERAIPRWVLGAIMIFGLPILDTSLALLRRVRLRRPIFSGDRSHLYDQLVDRGFSVRQTVSISYGLAAFYGIVGLGIILIPSGYGWYALLIYVAVAALTLAMCWRLGFLDPPQETPREREQRQQIGS